MIRTIIQRLFQRSPLLRLLVIPLLFLFFVILGAGIARLATKAPVLTTLSPAIGEPGEVMVIQGRHFGKERLDGWIEIGGSRLTDSAYISWTDTVIMATLPPTVDDGLVYVANRFGKSAPLIFANKNNIPVAAQVNVNLGLPVIESLDIDKVQIGKQLVITGRNFGITRNKSLVLFSWQVDPALPVTAVSPSDQPNIACSDHDFDYALWSDQELRVQVPDGATSGNVCVQTDQGLSNALSVQVTGQCGTKKFPNRHTFVLSLEVDISGVSAAEGNMLFLRVPMPEETASQRGVQVTAVQPKPYMDNYRGNILHQLENLKSGRSETISHSFLLVNHGITTSINPALVQSYADVKSPLYLMYTAADPVVLSDNQEIILQAAKITGAERNPYLKAKLIYSWVSATIKPASGLKPDRSVLDALKTLSGDSYDRALLFCALARASGIPAIEDAGILVDARQNSEVHWWAEFYLENFGWVPVDPGLEDSGSTTWFGTIDSDHIAFSRGWTEQKPMTAKSKIVYKPHSFAFQPIWEESGGNIKGYTSFWADPKVTGVY